MLVRKIRLYKNNFVKAIFTNISAYELHKLLNTSTSNIPIIILNKKLIDLTEEDSDSGAAVFTIIGQNKHLKIKKGAALAALSSGKNIVPVRISTDEDFLFINQPFYAVGEKTVTFEIEMCDEIKIDDFKSESEIVTKKRISQQIEKSLYGL